MSNAAFAARIRERYPEGLTGVFAVGATRRTYILEQNRDAKNPGNITDFHAMGDYLIRRYLDLIGMFFGLGGQNMLITVLSFRSFFERGPEYAAMAAPELLRLFGDEACAFYRANDIDPYFVGVDTLMLLPEGTPGREAAQQIVAFQKRWHYAEGRRKLLWEVASIPLFSFWLAFEAMDDEERLAINHAIASAPNLGDIYQRMYARFARIAYGTDFPITHLYVGTNMSGDLKWRSPMPLALTGGDYVRMFYTPYPTLFMTEETMQGILEDLAFGKRFHSLNKDYSGRYSHELVESEYQRIMELRDDPTNVLGLSRRVEPRPQMSRV